MQDTVQNRKPRAFIFYLSAFILLFALAFALRIWGIRWSLPYVVHPDEPVMVDTAISMIKRGSLDPDFFEYPSLFIYWQYAITQLWLLWQSTQHTGVTAANLPDTSHIYTFTPSLYMWGRAAAALLGAVGVVISAWVGSRIFGNVRIGLIAGLLLAVSPFHSENSHYIEVDVMMWTLATLTLLLTYEISVRGPNHRWLALAAGLLVGLTTGAKYTGLAMLGVVGLGWLISLRLDERLKIKDKRLDANPHESDANSRFQVAETPQHSALSTQHWLDAITRLILIALGTALGFIIATPYFLLDNHRFWQSYGKQANFYKPVSTLDTYFGHISDYIAKLWPGEWFIILPGLLGLALLLVRRDWRRFLLLGPIVFVYLAAVSYLGQTYPRNGYLSVVMLVFPAAYLLDTIANWCARVVETRKFHVEKNAATQLSPNSTFTIYHSTFTIIILALLIIMPLRQTVNWNQYLSLRDGALLAQDWMQAQRAQGKRFAVELHPWQFQDWPDVIAVYTLGSKQQPLTSQPPSYYANLGYDYVILSSDEDKTRKLNAADHLKEYQALPTITSFRGDHTGGKGPDLTVYQVGQGFSQLAIEHRFEAKFGNLATLRGLSLGPVADAGQIFNFNPAAHPALARGNLLGVNLYFQADQPDGRDWTLFLHLIAATGQPIAQIDVPTRYAATIPHPTSKWQRGEYIIGGYSLPIPATAPPGPYTLELGLYDPATFARIPLTAANQTVRDNALIISNIEVK